MTRLPSFVCALACAWGPVLLGGCGDQAAPAPAPGVDAPAVRTARDRFDNEVYPILSLYCGGCHSQTEGQPRGFVGADPATAYEHILDFPNVLGDFLPSAPVANVPASSHNGVTYRASERAAILEWLAAELAERGGPAPSTVEAEIQAWSGCLDSGDFTAAGVAPAWAALTSSPSGACQSCHAPEGTVLYSPDPAVFFNLMTTRRAHLLGLFTPGLAGQPAQVQMMINPRFVTVGTRQPPYSQHPAFTFTGSPAEAALKTLYDATSARRAAATCAPPRLID